MEKQEQACSRGMNPRRMQQLLWINETKNMKTKKRRKLKEVKKAEVEGEGEGEGKGECMERRGRSRT